MRQAKEIESRNEVRDSDMAGDLALILKIARRLAIRTGDPRLVSCTDLALHLLDEQSRDSKAH